jgi:hypothetical protein
MGRAFRVVKRTAHLTVHVTERPLEIVATPEPGTPKRPRGAKPKTAGAKASGAKKKTAGAKSTTRRKQAAK